MQFDREFVSNDNVQTSLHFYYDLKKYIELCSFY